MTPLRKIDLVDDAVSFSYNHHTPQGIFVCCEVDLRGIPYQHFLRQLFEEKIAEFVNNLQTMNDDESRQSVEKTLQEINDELKIFYEKFVDETFDGSMLRGVFWCVVDGRLLCSLLGEGSVFLFRAKKIHYYVSNTVAARERSLFSDLLEGELGMDDTMLVFGADYNIFLSKKDIKNLNPLLIEAGADPLDIFQKLLLSRVDPEVVGWMLWFDYDASLSGSMPRIRSKQSVWTSDMMAQAQKILFMYRYGITIVVMTCILGWLGWSLFRDIATMKSNVPEYQDGDQTKIVTIETIQQDIAYFQKLDATSATKSQYYKQIMEHLAFLEGLNRRPDDVKKLKTIVQNKYYEGFNVVYINDVANNDDTPALLTFSSTERQTLGTPLRLFYNGKVLIAGTQGGLVGSINNDIRGSLVAYSLSSEMMAGCSHDIARAGMYCFTNSNNIFRITEGGIEPVKYMEEEDTVGFFDTPIRDIAVFARNNFYVLHSDPSLLEGNQYITRYRNTVGSFTDFSQKLRYAIVGNEFSGKNLELVSMSIDGSFLARSRADKQLYQLWRGDSVSSINARAISMQGGDFFENIGENVRVYTQEGSNYVFFFDQEKQLFTVFKSTPLKTQERFQYSYNLQYVFQFTFDLETDSVLDIALPEAKAQGNYLYFLTKNGVHQVALDEFLQQYDK